MSWPSFENIHKRLAKAKDMPQELCIATEKIDGSNLSIAVHNGQIYGIYGRNTKIWGWDGKCDPSKVAFSTMKYCKGPSLDGLVNTDVPKLCKLAEMMNIQKHQCLRVFGEWYRGGWYPFGVRVVDATVGPFAVVDAADAPEECEETEEAETTDETTMADEVVDVANAGVAAQKGRKVFTQSLELRKMMEAVGLNVPRLLAGPAPMDAIVKQLHPLFTNAKDPNPDFEGVFITTVNGGSRNACKFKTPFFEEQPAMPAVETYHPSIQPTAALLKEIFDLKSVLRKPKVAKGEKEKTEKSPEQLKLEEECAAQMALALNSVLSKTKETIDDFKAMTKDGKSQFLEQVLAATLADAKSQYASVDGLAMPPDDLLLKIGRPIVYAQFFKK